MMQQHSGEHIISGIICSELGCDNVGFHLGTETVTIDYNKYADLSIVKEIELSANKYIEEDHQSMIFVPDKKTLSEINYRSKKEIDEDVRIVSFPGADTCACCGTHLSSSAQVILILVISHKRFHDGMRLEILCGRRAVDYLNKSFEQNSRISRLLSVPLERTGDTVERLLQQHNYVKESNTALEEQVFSLIAEKFVNNGDTYIIREEMDPVSLRRLCDLIYDTCGGFCIIFSGSGNNYRYALMCEEEKLTSLTSYINTNLNGRGGGRSGLAQGSIIADADMINSYMSKII